MTSHVRPHLLAALMVGAVAVSGVAVGVDRAAAKPTASAPLRILLTNDDGPTASGGYLTELRDALCAAGNAVTVVVPATDQSGNGTRITVKGTLTAAKSTFTCGSGEGTEYAVSTSIPANASPPDAVLFGLKVLFADSPPDLVVSGMNPGANVGRVTNHSGTVGAAVTAMEQGVPAIAVSMQWNALDATRGFTGAAAARPAANSFVVDLIKTLQRDESGHTLLSGGGLNINWPVVYDKVGLQLVPPTGVQLTRVGSADAITLGYTPLVGDKYAVAVGLCKLPNPCAAETRKDADTTALDNNRVSVSSLDGDWSTGVGADLSKVLREMRVG
jgi:5'-nucleotidase